MAKAQETKTEIQEVKTWLNPFGVFPRDHVSHYSGKVTDPLLAQFELKLVQETGSTEVVLKDPLDLQAQIQTFKDQCGMEQAQLLLKRGLAAPEDFQAKPGDYGDTSTLADNINDAYQEALKTAQGSKIDLGMFKTDKDIMDYVQAQVEAALKAAQPKAGQPKEEKTEVKDNA